MRKELFLKKRPLPKKGRKNPRPSPKAISRDSVPTDVPLKKTGLDAGYGRIFEINSIYACGLFALFTALFLWPFLTHRDWIPGNGDMEFIWPYRYVWIESLKRGYPMLWNPYSSLGQPFLANCNPQVFAPFNFLFFFLPTSYGFTWSYFFHFLIAAFGTYLFIRGLGTGWTAACLGGLAFAFSGFFMGHFLFGGHNSVNGAAWLPLVLYGLKRFLDLRQFSALLLSSAAFGCLSLDAMPQYVFYTLMITGFFLVWTWISGGINWKGLLKTEVLFIAMSFSLGLCQLAPTFQMAQLSNRWSWNMKEIMRDCFVPENFRFLISPFSMGIPEHDYHGTGGYAEVIIYIGVIPIILAFFGFWGLLKRPMVRWFGLVAVLSMLLAMADSTPFTHYVYMFFSKILPGLSHNREVSRIMVLTAFALACLAGLALDAWTRYWRQKPGLPGLSRAFLVFWVPAFLLLGTAVDLYRFDAPHAAGYGGSSAFFTDLFPADLLQKIKEDPTYPRVQPGSTYCEYQLLQNISSVYTGCTSFFIQTTQDYIDEEYGHPDSPLVDLINLKYSYRPDGSQPTPRWQRVPGIVPGSVWENTQVYPRAFMVGGYSVDPDYSQAISEIRDGKVDPRQEVVLTQDPSEKPEGPKGWVGEAKITRYDYNDLEIECTNNRPCFLFLSDAYYPGWKSWVDGKEGPIYLADGTFRAVPLLNAGSHRVKMSYYPPIIIYSFFYSLFAWIALAVGWAFHSRLDQWFSTRFGEIFSLPSR